MRVMRDENARAESDALKLIFKAGNAKYIYVIPPNENFILFIIYKAKTALKNYLCTHHLNIQIEDMDNRHVHNKATRLTENRFVTERSRFRVAVFEIQAAANRLITNNVLWDLIYVVYLNHKL